MKILFVASECSPMAKVGGLADVVGSLPKALKPQGVNVAIALPFYEVIKIKKNKLKLIKKNIPVFFQKKETSFNLWQTFLPESRVPLFLIENKEYFAGKGIYPADDASSSGSKSEAVRFSFLSIASIKVAKLLKVEVLHCHDWHTALIPFLIKKEKNRIKTLLSIHNLGYQGVYDRKTINNLLGSEIFKKDKKINSVKIGILNADFINTVSPSYAKEILTKKYGFGLQRYLQKRKKNLTGILNGLDEDQFSPEKDSYLKKKYSWRKIEDKNINKAFLQKKCFGRTNSKIPTISIISRLADQKGFTLIKDIFKSLMKENCQFVLLGKGAKRYESLFLKFAKKFPEKCWVRIDFDEKLAHQIYAGSDIFLMPSYFEPCGLGQQIAMKYGTIPVARKTGGIKDTVFEVKTSGKKVEGTGFLFQKYTGKALLSTTKKALRHYDKKNVWRAIQLNGMKQDLSWQKSAKKYKALYKKILAKQ